MQDERWLDLIESIREKFSILSEETEPVFIEQNDGTDQEIGQDEIVIFNNPLGKLKMVRTTTPLVTGRDEQYHKRSGVATTKFIYSDTEKVHRVALFKWNEDKSDWEKIDTKGMFSI